MYDQLSIMPRVGVAVVVAVCVALPGVTWAKNETQEKNPNRPFDQMLRQIGILNDRIHAFPRRGMTGPCDVPPVRREKFPGAERFVVVLNGVAYCDQETGLVWENFPAAGFFNWPRAISHCVTRQLGNRKGWALPSRKQLASLVDTNSILCLGGGLCLPDGHPFQNVQSANYWSASTTPGSPTFAWLVNFFLGGELVMNLDGKGLAWCVRGAQSSDGQDLAAIE